MWCDMMTYVVVRCDKVMVGYDDFWDMRDGEGVYTVVRFNGVMRDGEVEVML